MWILFLLLTFISAITFNTKYQRTSLLIITFLATSGFQLFSTGWFRSPLLLSKPYDYAYVAIIIIFLTRTRDLYRVIATIRVATIATLYLGFIVLVLIASVAVYSYPFTQSFQSARVFMGPIFLLFFLLAERATLEKYVRALVWIVIFTSFLYLLQPITGKNIINPDSEFFNPYLGATDTKRFLATPDFLIFFILLFFYDISKNQKASLGLRLGRWIALILLLSVQVASFTRSALMATGVALMYVGKRILNPILVIMFMVTVLGAGAVTYATSSVVKDRIDESLKDVASSLDGNYLNYRPGTDGNLSFRLAHFNERWSYVIADVARWPMGIAFIHEDSAAAQNLAFKIGVKNLYTGRVVQVDTGDIAWSVVVIKTGLLGLGFMLLLLASSFFAVGPADNKYAVVYRGGLVYFLITSFFSINLTMPAVVLQLMLFLALAIKERQTLTSETTLPKRKF